MVDSHLETDKVTELDTKLQTDLATTISLYIEKFGDTSQLSLNDLQIQEHIKGILIIIASEQDPIKVNNLRRELLTLITRIITQ